jgi:ParB/RepB/Spo0J family partition protein
MSNEAVLDAAVQEAAQVATGVLREIPLSSIVENPVALRNVDTESEEFIGLAESIKTHGVLNPILVRPIVSDQPGVEKFGLIDGLQRFTASQLAGRQTISAKVLEMSDADVLEAQILTNVHRVETKPVEYSKQLLRVLGQNPSMTLAQLADRLSKSSAWLEQRLGLVGLIPELATLTDEGKISLPNAYVLAKLPSDEQANHIEEAQTSPSQDFLPKINARIKEIREAKRQGRAANPPTFTPVPRLQKVTDLKAEVESPSVGPALIAKTGTSSVTDAFKLGVLWALKLDPVSVEEAKNKFDAQAKEAAEKKLRRDEEKKKKLLEKQAQQDADVKKKLAELSV